MTRIQDAIFNRKAIMATVFCCVVAIGRLCWFTVESDNKIHAAIVITRSIEKFISLEKRWPASWDELEKHAVDGPTRSWPKDRPFFVERIEVDFAADLESVGNSNPNEFNAVRIRGNGYEGAKKHVRYYFPKLIWQANNIATGCLSPPHGSPND